ncbi:hypothetical protein [Psychromonas hadalis]|uniref:hypothetical protein n=1 Tax=Psychromonas hadalis TaxID=211669 RepID=UPI0003B65973|nr:hypothetical protein [Psychromonas hadalis]
MDVLSFFLDQIITELDASPSNKRYLISVDHNGHVLDKQGISGKSLVDAQAARYLRRDVAQMAKRMSELTRRVGILSGDMGLNEMKTGIH